MISLLKAPLLLLALSNSVSALFEPRFISFGGSSDTQNALKLDSVPFIYTDAQDFPGIHIAATTLATDFENVTGVERSPSIPPIIKFNSSGDNDLPSGNQSSAIIVGSVASPLITSLVQSGKLNVSSVEGLWETFVTAVIDDPGNGIPASRALVIAGSDKRGTIFGIYTLSEQLGVSPWYWWADVPTPQRTDPIFALPVTTTHGPPSVKYRGLFLNDESPALNTWVEAKLSPPNGLYTTEFYEKLFELLLRLKANYLWPAMWPSFPPPGESFFVDDPLNQATADKYGVVVSTSHQEPMQRATNEWLVSGMGDWNWDVNKGNVTEFFREGVERAEKCGCESYVTIGMRGAGDVGIEGGDPKAILQEVIATQRDLIKDAYGNETGVNQVWALYKEVQALYEAGLSVPDDVTLFFSDDNFGTVRRLPTEAEKARSGGVGVYYHLEFVGDPRSYKWMNTNSLAKAQYSLSTAKQRGADRIWVINVGDLKPMETPLSMIMTMAYNASAVTADNIPEFLRAFVSREFSSASSDDQGEIAELLMGHSRLNGLRRHEHVESTTYSLSNYREADTFIGQWESLLSRAESINDRMQEAWKPAFFQLVLQPIKASRIFFALKIAQAKNTQYAQLRRNSANDFASQALQLFDDDFDLQQEWDSMLGGKWLHIMRQTHYGFTSDWRPPYRDALISLSYVQLRQDSIPAVGQMGVSVEGNWGSLVGLFNEGSELAMPSRGTLLSGVTLPSMDPFGAKTRWFEVYGRGSAELDWSAQTDEEWVKLSASSGRLSKGNWDNRVEVSIDWDQVPDGFNSTTLIRINATKGYEEVHLPVIKNTAPTGFSGFVQGDGFVSMEAAHFTDKGGETEDVAYEEVPYLSRTFNGSGAVGLFPVTANTSSFGPWLEYKFYWFSAAKNVTATLYFTMALDTDPNNPLQFTVALDSETPGDAIRLAAAPANAGDLPTGWSDAAQNLVWKKTVNLGDISAGEHSVRYWASKPEILLEKIEIASSGSSRTSYLGLPESLVLGAWSTSSAAFVSLLVVVHVVPESLLVATEKRFPDDLPDTIGPSKAAAVGPARRSLTPSSRSPSHMDNAPNSTNIHTIVKAQIVFLLSTLTEDNFERNQLEIRSLSEQHGVETYLHFIRRLIVHSQSNSSSNLTFRLLTQEVQRISRDPFLADRFRDGIDKGEGEVFRHFDLVRFLDRVSLRPLERLVLAASVASGSSRKELVTQATSLIQNAVEFENAVLSLCHNPSFDHADLSPHQVSKLMSNLLSDPPQDAPILDPSQRQALIVAAQTKYGQETVAPILQRIFPTLSLPPGTTLVQLLLELGPDITNDPDVVRALLLGFGISDSNPPRDDQVIEIVSTLSRKATEGAPLCDVPALIRALSSFHSSLNWANVIKSFDQPDRHGVDTATLKLLIAILLNSPRDTESHAVTGFWSLWSNSLYQLRLLDALLSLPADTFNFVHLPGQRIVTLDDVVVASPTIKSLAANVQGHTWNSLDLFEVLVRMADSDSPDIQNVVRDMLDKAIKISAELVHMGLLQVPDAPWNEIRLEYSRKLLAMFLAGHTNHQLVFMRIWQVDPTYLSNAFRDFYEDNQLNITRILDVAQDLKILESLLDVRPFAFALDLASLASRREYLNLDKWLMDNVTAHGGEFLHAVLAFLEEKMQFEKTMRTADPQPESRTMSLGVTTITIILRMLRANQSLMEEGDQQFWNDVKNHCLQVYPRLMSMIPNTDVEPGYSVINYSAEIEAEVDGIYRAMYDESTSIDDVINLLQRSKESTNPRDQEILACMLHFLFDEYKFFQSSYPMRELLMTGYLFGALVQHKLIEYIPLGIAIRYILDALDCPPETNLFKFGLQALSQFESRLQEWRPLCEALVRNVNLADARPDLVAVLQRHLASTADGPLNMRAVAADAVSPVFTAIQPELVDGEIETPPEELSDKILFIINNLAPSNFDAKLAEMKELFLDDYARWFANYLVDQRISTEPNNHSLYLRFLDALDRKAVNQFILHETFVKSMHLLNSERTMNLGTERTMLKNVGGWLGSITLARDQPIKHKNVSFKELLIEGYDAGRTTVAIPFVCKVLEAGSRSRVFRPPNPWLMAVMSILAELYFFAELKLNYKFEIEVLCTSLDIDLDAVEPSMVLRNRPNAENLAGPPLPEYVEDINSLPMGGYDPGSAQHLSQGDSQQVLGLATTASDSTTELGPLIEAILNNLERSVQISRQLAPLDSNPSFRRAVQFAAYRAVRDIISPVVERSVTIAGISTKELVAKDFATEAHDDKLRKAAHSMAQKLAGSLALVTCKEPLKVSLASNIRTMLMDQGFAEAAQQPNLIEILVSDNLELACAAIEKAAMERAVSDVDEGFAVAYEARRRHRETRPGQAFWDSNAPPSTFSMSLPEPLRIKASGVQPIQAAVYEAFSSRKDNGQNLAIMSASRPGSTMPIHIPGIYTPSPAPPENLNPTVDHQEAMEGFQVMVRDLEALVTQLPMQSLVQLPTNHDVRFLVRNILSAADSAGDRSRTPLQISQKIVQLLYKTPTNLGREVFVALLENLCQSFDEVAKEAITWLLYAEDERKWNIPVTFTLLRAQLITVSPLDQQLAKMLFMNPRPNLMDYVAGLIRECLTSDPPVATQSQFTFTIDVLSTLVSTGKANEEVTKLIDDLRGIRREAPRPASTKPGLEGTKEKLFLNFQGWVAIYQRSHSPEKNFISYVTQLTRLGFGKEDEVSLLFFRVCAESSVDHYMKCVGTGNYSNAFIQLDAMSRLIVLMIKYHGDASGHNEQMKVHYLTKILSIFVLVLANLHEEQGPQFQQKPFFRFFSSLINDFHAIEASLGSAYFHLLICISDAFSSLQPTYFPGFSFSWMCLISHRLFMPKLLLSENREACFSSTDLPRASHTVLKGWSAFHKLLLSLFKFLAPFLKDADLQPAARDLYRGTLRILLVLLHDFPEFLSEYYFTLCDAIPARCIQLRNIVLSAFPRTLVLPDPHLRNIALDSIPEMGPIPPILSDFTSSLKNSDIRGNLDQYLLSRGSPSFLTSLKDKLRYPSGAEGVTDTYNLSLINCLVMYIGVSSVAQAKARSGTSVFIPSEPGVVALQYLANNMDVEGQHHLLSAIVLHLRYPNAHTNWFSALLLHLFIEVKDDVFREIMTKVLLERFIVHRPHPWGALVTFIELLRNTKYEFWSKEFIRIAPEVTMLLESVRIGSNLRVVEDSE
ncbi:CCR4-NOT core subunit cdc39 [Marasmius crinis-equi]|uniref:CCR4-NOT core subunit cdc39 n=1 Tax=Marasmius crinis-equi TaxID=585013 RepID=A0ABR3FR14_9AGAR